MATMGQIWKHLRWRVSPANLELARLALWPRRRATRTLLVTPGLEVIDGPSFFFTYPPIFRFEQFRFKSSRPQPRVLDCGANIGLATIYVKRLYPAARVTAFEPDPALFGVLSRNVARACGASGVELVQAAVWDGSSATVRFRQEGADAGRVGGEPATTDAVDVLAVRLRDWLTEPIDLLKLDIEGAEGRVLADCADRLSQVEHLFVEYHSFEGQRQEVVELLALLRDAGFRLDVYSEREPRTPLVSPQVYLGMDSQFSVFASRCR